VLDQSTTGFDRTETWAAQDFRSAKALFVPSLNRDIVPSIGMHTTSGGRGRMAIHIRRREFIFTLGGAAAAWPLVARGQQPAVPVIGFLRSTAAADSSHLVAAFHQGLKEVGFVEGQNVAIASRCSRPKPQPRRCPSSSQPAATRRPVGGLIVFLTSRLNHRN